jgi:hypothetical protein
VRTRKHWQTVAKVVLMAAEDRGPLMHARIGMLKAHGAIAGIAAV